jgi:glycyl-tRNA synthetase beta chain
VPLMGKFDQAFFIDSRASTYFLNERASKVFSCARCKSQLLPAFITVANIESTDPAQVIDGNERVIRPRLADAAFFYENDKKTTLRKSPDSLKEYRISSGSWFCVR